MRYYVKFESRISGSKAEKSVAPWTTSHNLFSLLADCYSSESTEIFIAHAAPPSIVLQARYEWQNSKEILILQILLFMYADCIFNISVK